MKTFSIRAAIRHGWGIFKSNKKTLIGATFVLMVAGALLNMAKGSFHKYGLSAVVVWAAILVASIILRIGYLKMLLKLEDGDPVMLRELYAHSKLFLKYAVTGLLYGLMTAVGLVLLVIPGIYVLITYCFAPVIVIDEFVTPQEAFRRSARMTAGRKWHLLGLMLVVIIMNIVGTIPALLGLFVTIPVATSAYLRVYREILNHTEREARA